MEGERSALLAPRSDRLARWALAIATGAIVLVLYTTVALPYRTALVTQAALILLFTLLLVCVGLAMDGWLARVRRLGLPVALGLGLYLATAVMAAVVGLVRGNELSLIAGQTLSMGLLPLGALAAASLPTTRHVRTFSVSLVTATTVAALIHLIHWARSLNTAQPVLRLYLGNNVSVTGISLMALLLAFALVTAPRTVRRLLAGVAAVTIVIFIVGTGTRSLWLATMIGLALLIVTSRAWRMLGRPRNLLVVGLCLGALTAAIAGIAAWTSHPPRNEFPDTTFASPFWILPPVQTGISWRPAGSPDGPPVLEWRRVPLAHSAAVSKPVHLKGGQRYRLSASLLGAPETRCAISMGLWEGAWQPGAWIGIDAPSASSWTHASREFVTPDGPLQGQLIVTAESVSSEPCRASGVRLERVREEVLPSLKPQVEQLRSRWQSLVDSLAAGLNAKDDNVAFRVRESKALLDHFASASVVEKIVGHGLGARFDLRTMMWNWDGRRIWVEAPNYIHNFYAFLLYKTGLLGLIATLTAMMLWALTLRQARDAGKAREERTLWAAALAALGAYAVWSLVCPEILDFRIAPLWGFLLAACGVSRSAASDAQVARDARSGA